MNEVSNFVDVDVDVNVDVKNGVKNALGRLESLENETLVFSSIFICYCFFFSSTSTFSFIKITFESL